MLAVLGQALQDSLVMFVLLHSWIVLTGIFCGEIVLVCEKLSHSVVENGSSLSAILLQWFASRIWCL
jgi:hypothetical protein